MESIPEGLDFPEASTGNPSTSQAWLGLLARAHSSLDIASFYWTLTNSDTHTQESSAQQVPGKPGPGGKQGEVRGIRSGGERVFLQLRRQLGMSHSMGWTQVLGSNCLHMALRTGGEVGDWSPSSVGL